MRIYRYEQEGKPRLAVGNSEHTYDLATLFEAAGRETPEAVAHANMRSLCVVPNTMLTDIRDFLTCARLETLRRLDPSELTLLPPIADPQKIICVGLNYLDHCEEQDKPAPATPVLFAKFANALAGPHEDIPMPTTTRRLDYEGELAVVMGTCAKGVSEEEALKHVFGYMVAHDVSARDLQKRDGQWLRAKSQDKFAPMGPCIITADEVPDPQSLDVTTRLNGTVMQHSNTGRMTFSVAHLIHFITEGITLAPGDIILTGTPSGVGAHRTPPVFLQPGDEVEIEISGLGRIRNRFV